jgi:hypothetical protein
VGVTRTSPFRRSRSPSWHHTAASDAVMSGPFVRQMQYDPHSPAKPVSPVGAHAAAARSACTAVCCPSGPQSK